jgi:low affinity Fe/Cu permease
MVTKKESNQRLLINISVTVLAFAMLLFIPYIVSNYIEIENKIAEKKLSCSEGKINTDGLCVSLKEKKIAEKELSCYEGEINTDGLCVSLKENKY